MPMPTPAETRAGSMSSTRRVLFCLAWTVLAAAALPASAQQASSQKSARQAPPAKSEVRDARAKARLLGKHRLSLQWISWDYFGTVAVTEVNGLIKLSGEQKSRSNSDFVRIEGIVTTIDAGTFTFLGTITQRIGELNAGQPCA